MQQIAVLRFENLSPDAGADWVGRGVSEGLAGAVQPSPSQHVWDVQALHRFDASLGKRITAVPGVSYELPNARAGFATRVICGYYTVSGGDRVEVSAVELDTGTQQTRKVASVTGALPQLTQLTVQLARQLGYATQAGLTASGAALRSYAEGLETPNLALAREKFGAALAADPGFGAAYLLLARSDMALADRAGFSHVMAQAAQHGAQIAPYYRASLAALQAEVQGDAAARLAALAGLQRAAPADPLVLRFLGDAEVAQGNYGAGIVHYRQAARAAPQDPDLHNLLAYAHLTQGDESAALREAAEYARLAPGGANPADSLGDVQFHFNHFAEATQAYLEAFRRDPDMDASGALDKAAVSQLLAGDLTKANQLHQRYVQVRVARHDPVAALRQADWYFLTGKKAEAIASARQFQQGVTVPQLQAAASTRIAAWQLQLGQTSEAALTLGQPGPAELTSLLAAFAEAPDDEQFNRRIEQLYPGPANQKRRLLASGYRLLLARQWARALPLWKAIADNPNADTARAIYAFLLFQTGSKTEAAKFAATTPLWHPNQDDVFASLWFRGLLAVRAATGPDAERAARVYQAIGKD